MESLAPEEVAQDAAAEALAIVDRLAFEYIEHLQPGDRFLGLQAEAARHFDIGSEEYGMFIARAIHHMTDIAMDVDAEGRIVSIVRKSAKAA